MDPPVSAVALAGGVRSGGRTHRDAWVRPLVGHDEEYLAEVALLLPAARRATALLARTVQRIGSVPSTEDAVRGLCAGDRESLVWQVWRLTWGDAVDVVVGCDACGEKLDVRLDAAQAAAASGEVPLGPLREQVGGRAVTFRVPTGADLEEAGDAPDERSGVSRLLRRLVTDVDGGPAGPDDLDRLAGPLAERLADLDPGAETWVRTVCPACGADLASLVDPVALVSEEVARGARGLLQEVHLLASTYHWTEDVILSLPTPRRRRYLDLVAGDAPWSGP